MLEYLHYIYTAQVPQKLKLALEKKDATIKNVENSFLLSDQYRYANIFEGEEGQEVRCEN